ncbi:MAG: YIP1 family protein [Desulfurivibrionaceae bacterium]
MKTVPATALEVITNPTGFFRQMPKTGGFLPPLLFMALMGVAGGLLQVILALVGLGGDLMSGLLAVILIPLLVGIFSFVGAAILFMFWKILGSEESFETAFRCGAYTAAILPLTTLLNVIPYLGSILGLVWMTYLLVLASTEVHGIAAKKAWVAFGALCAIMAITSVSMEIAARKISKGMENWQQTNQAQFDSLDKLEEMSPEEAGQAMGQFLKAFGQTAQEE